VISHGYERNDVTFILQPMMAAKAELILGVSWEHPLGHFLVCGLGGIYTEVLDEVILLPIPLARATIAERIEDSKIGRLLSAVGGAKATKQTVDALVSLQSLVQALGDKIHSIDVNPLLIHDSGCVAVDALVVPRKD